MKPYRLAPMSFGIAVLTAILLALPVVFIVAAHHGAPALRWPAVFMVGIFAWIRLWFRPTRFEVHGDALVVSWPLRRVRIPRADISGVRVLDGEAMKREIGWGLRVGAGGLWGGFGWLHTQHRGRVRFYISRTDRLVWIERRSGEPWLITPEDPAGFCRSLWPLTGPARSTSPPTPAPA